MTQNHDPHEVIEHENSKKTAIQFNTQQITQYLIDNVKDYHSRDLKNFIQSLRSRDEGIENDCKRAVRENSQQGEDSAECAAE